MSNPRINEQRHDLLANSHEGKKGLPWLRMKLDYIGRVICKSSLSFLLINCKTTVGKKTVGVIS
jgi:hypothetical protein